ncbi:hypothetical protein Tco_1079222 [Tanacetum coccineum]|uniref:Uncharacterized protein n=1 Tax=Tanacetum coccineum TaxID=301880 RepID=A0ABQ5HRA1_9ASTR
MDVEVDEEAEEEHSAPAYPVVLDFLFPEPLPVQHGLILRVPDCLLYLPTSITTILCFFITHPVPFPLSPPSPVLTAPPPSPIRSLGYRAAMIRMRAEAAANFSSLHYPPTSYSPPPDQMHHTMPNISSSFISPILLVPDMRWREGFAVVLLDQNGGFFRQITALLPLWTGRSGVTQRDMLDMGSRIHGMRLLRPYRAPVSYLDIELGHTDRRRHAHTRLLMETEARMSREAWGRSMDASDLARAEVMSLRTQFNAQMSGGSQELQSADRSRASDFRFARGQTTGATLQREMIPLQGLVTTLQGQGQQGPAGGPTQPELPEEAGSST